MPGNHHSRRGFLQRLTALSALGPAASFANSLSFIGDASAATADDYKALVCVFLYGGNDHANTLIPFDSESHSLYASSRPDIAIGRESLQGSVLQPENDLGGRSYALNPALGTLLPYFQAGNLAVIQNVGTLRRPVTKAQLLLNPGLAPPQLYSHNSQQVFFQSGQLSEGNAGWGGLIGDVLASSNQSSFLTCVNASGNATFITGRNGISCTTSPDGALKFFGGGNAYDNPAVTDAIKGIVCSSGANVFEQQYASVAIRSIKTSGFVDSALAYAPEESFPYFSEDNDLSKQLKVIARMIACSGEAGIKRQVFFASMNGWDTHSNFTQTHPILLRKLSSALKEFYDTTVALGVQDKVTTFTASDFGRTLSSNGDGTDHGWGGVQFVLGGAVRGGRVYGVAPVLGLNTSNDLGRGRLIPTTSVNQLAATMAMWMGVAPGDLPGLLPDLANFDPRAWYVGFL